MNHPKTLCLAASIALFAACSTSDDEPTWHLDLVEDSGALMSVWGSSADDVWVVGGQKHQSLALHGTRADDGSTVWSTIETGGDQLLWWVYGFRADDVYAVGEEGLILHYDGDRWTEVVSGTSQTLFGVWGQSGDDVWIVGGDPNGAPGSAVVLRGNETGFHPIEVPASDMPSALFKVYGGPQGLIAVGTGGTILRTNADGAWIRQAVPTDEPLFSLWGRGDSEMYAVGGFGNSEFLRYDGASWQSMNVPGQRRLSGVFTADDHPTIAVGDDAYIVEVDTDETVSEVSIPLPDFLPSLHSVWGDGQGTTYAVGGSLHAYPQPMRGVLYRRQ